MAIYKISIPVYYQTRELQEDNKVIVYPITSLTVFTVLQLILAPIMLFILLNDNLTEAFIRGAVEGLLEDKVDK